MTETIERELDLPATPARVWHSLTDPARLAQWLADEATLELRPGGDACFRIGDELRTGWIEEVCPPAEDPGSDSWSGEGPRPREDLRSVRGALVFWWGLDGEPASRVALTLTGTADGTTRLRIVETRPLEVLDLVGVPLPGPGGARYGPALVAA